MLKVVLMSERRPCEVGYCVFRTSLCCLNCRMFVLPRQHHISHNRFPFMLGASLAFDMIAYYAHGRTLCCHRLLELFVARC